MKKVLLVFINSVFIILLVACQQNRPEVDTPATQTQIAGQNATIEAHNLNVTATISAITVTAGAEQTAEAETTSTHEALLAATSTAGAAISASATAEAIATADEIARLQTVEAEAAATSTAIADAQATEVAGTRLANQLIATAQAQAQADRAALFAEAEVADSHELLVAAADEHRREGIEAIDGSISHNDDEFIELWPNLPLYQESNFVVEVTFENPYALTVGSWDYGLLVRTDSTGHYRVIIFSNGEWELREQKNDDDETVRLASGRVPNFDNSANGSNHIKLIVYNTRGVLFINNQFAGDLDLSSRTLIGDIYAVTGFYFGNSRAGASTHFTGFQIWTLPD